MLYKSVLRLHQFRYLGAFYLHSITRLFAVSTFQIFSGIYVYQSLINLGLKNHQALASTSLIYALYYLVHALAVAPSLWLISKRGLKFSVFWGNIALIVFFIFLYLGRSDPIFFIIAALSGGIQIGFYWTAYHIYFIKLTDDKRQGEEISISALLSAIAAIGGPAFGGLLISYAGFGAMFLVMTVLMVLALWPLRYLPKQSDTVSVNIMSIFAALSPKKEEHSFLALFGSAIVDLSSLIFWPIFVFPLLSGFVGLGYMGSLVALVAAVITIASGFLIDKFSPKKIINIFSSLDSIIWVVRIFVINPFQVFITSSLAALTEATQSISVDSMIYQRARHSDIVAFVVQREVGLAVGRSLFMIAMGIMFWFGMPLIAAFIFAGIAALFTRLYPDPKIKK